MLLVGPAEDPDAEAAERANELRPCRLCSRIAEEDHRLVEEGPCRDLVLLIPAAEYE